jgi:hypothetical protein
VIDNVSGYNCPGRKIHWTQWSCMRMRALCMRPDFILVEHFQYWNIKLYTCTMGHVTHYLLQNASQDTGFTLLFRNSIYNGLSSN